MYFYHRDQLWASVLTATHYKNSYFSDEMLIGVLICEYKDK